MTKNYFSLVLSTIFIVFFYTTTKGQEKYPHLLDYTNSSGEEGYTVFEYDGNKHLIKARWQLKDSSRWSKNYYLYNDKKQLTEIFREFSDGLTSSLKFKYDTLGNKTVEFFSRSDGIKGKSIFEYNSKGVLTKINCNKYYGWFDGEIVFCSDKYRRKLSASLIRNKIKLGEIKYEYFDEGLLKTEKWITPNWNQTFTWQYRELPILYTSSNSFIKTNSRFRLISENYSFNEESGGPSFFKYSKEGELQMKTFVSSDSLKTETTYRYNNDGILKESIRNYSDNSIVKFNYSFDKKRQLIQRNCTYPNGNKGSERYFYDSGNKLEKAIWLNFDNWITGEITFTHSPSGNIKSGNFTGDKFEAELSFGYDEFGNLSTIIWNFSFGKTQTYKFEYEDLFQ